MIHHVRQDSDVEPCCHCSTWLGKDLAYVDDARLDMMDEESGDHRLFDLDYSNADVDASSERTTARRSAYRYCLDSD